MRTRYRSFFWPGVLILIGIIALLVNAGLVPADRLYRLADLWPLILVVVGLELITRRAIHGPAADVAGALIVLIAAGGALVYVAVGPSIPGGTHSLDASNPIGSITEATMTVDAGATTITMSGNSSLGPDLYHAHIEYSGPKPDVSLDQSTGDVHISQSSSFGFIHNQKFVLTLQINPQVPWKIVVNSGAANDTFKLTDVHVGSIELNTGASREDISLGAPTGVVPISVNGGALTVRLHRPSGTEASVQVSGGAVSLVADSHQYHGIGDESWQSASYNGAADAYRVDVSGGACTVSMDTTVSE